MSTLKDIPVVQETPAGAPPLSGEKYTTPQGFTAIRDGQKSRLDDSEIQQQRRALAGKPKWLKAALESGKKLEDFAV